MSGRDFDDLVGPDLEPGERDRLRRTHDLVVAAGPPPELPPALLVPPGAPPPAEVRTFPGGYPRRRLAAAVVLAAAIALAAFGAGYLTAEGRNPEAAFATDFVLPMRGTDSAPDARASLEVGERDEAGNWPMRMTIRNLAELPNQGRYELFLTKNGRLAVTCGTFTVEGEKTVVFLNAPYRLRQYDSWVITRVDSDRVLLETAEQQPSPETAGDDGGGSGSNSGSSGGGSSGSSGGNSGSGSGG